MTNLIAMSDIDTIISVLFGGGGLFGIYKLLRVLIVKIKKIIEEKKMKREQVELLSIEMSQLKYQLSSVVDMVKNMDTYFRPNGGNSLFDKVDRIDKNMIISQASNKHILSIIESKNPPIASFQNDGTGRCVWVSAEYLKIVGKSGSEICDFGWKNIISQDDFNDVMNAWNDAIRDKRDFDMTYNIKTIGGERKVRCIAKVIKDNSGNILAYQGSWFNL